MGGQLLVGIGSECSSQHACSEASGVTNQQRENFPAILNEIHFNNSAPHNVVMPWEMPAPLNAGQPAIIPSEARATAFEHAISFESRRMCPKHEQYIRGKAREVPNVSKRLLHAVPFGCARVKTIRGKNDNA